MIHGNHFSSTTIVVPITHVIKKTEQRTHVVINGNDYQLKYKNSMILAEQILTINKNLITYNYGTLNKEDLIKLNQALKTSINLWW